MELYIEPERPQRNALNGRFLKGHTPHCKGLKWDDFIPKEKQAKILSCLQRCGNKNIGGWNKRAVVGVTKTGLFVRYESGEEAGRRFNINSRNINACVKKRRKTAGGIYWFSETDDEWMKLVKSLKEKK
jgi:hypothetical protein